MKKSVFFFCFGFLKFYNPGPELFSKTLSTTISQMVPLRQTKWPPEVMKIEI